MSRHIPVQVHCVVAGTAPTRESGLEYDLLAGSPTGYLGGMALSGPLGWWDTGLGDGLPETRYLVAALRPLLP